MLLWLKSKMTMIVACIILIASLTGFMHIYKDTATNERLQNCCDSISSQINQLYFTKGDEMYQKIVFEEREDGFSIPKKIDRKRYDIIFHRNFVMVKQGNLEKYSELNQDVHLWNPANRNHSDLLSNKEVNWRDNNEDSFRVNSGNSDIIICMLKLKNKTILKRHVFVFKEVY